jgi:hypothetical protein
MSEQREQINAWANRALENLYGGWLALSEHQLILIIEATGSITSDTQTARRALTHRLGDVSWAEVYAILNARPAPTAATGGEEER